MLNLYKRHASLDDNSALIAANALGTALTALNRPKEAEEVLTPTLERFERIEGWSSRMTFAPALTLALAQIHRGKNDEAIGLLKRLVEAGSSVLGPSDPEHLNFVALLANAHVHNRYFLSGAQTFETLAVRYGESEANAGFVLTARENAAMALAHGGKLAQARATLEGLRKAFLARNQSEAARRIQARLSEVRRAQKRRASAPANAAKPQKSNLLLWCIVAVLAVIAAGLLYWRCANS